MIASRARSVAVAVSLLALALPAVGQTPNFDAKPTGFLTVQTGGMPADAWNGTSLATAKSLVSALPAAPRSRALRDLQFKVLVSQLTPPRPDGSPPPSLFALKAEQLAAMGEGESLNELVRGAGGYADPELAAMAANALMLAGERETGCAIVRSGPTAEPFARRADIACKLAAGDNAGALAAAAPLRSSDPSLARLAEVAAGALSPSAAPLDQLDGPAMVMLDLAHVPVPANLVHTTQPPVMRALVVHRALPMAARIDIAERGEALAIIEAARLSDLYRDALRERASLPAATARRARLVTAARDASNPDDVMRSVSAVYSESRGSPLFPTMARASAAGLLNLPAKPEYANVAQEAMRGFLLLGDKQRTAAWTRLALTTARSNARAMIALDRLMPLVAIAGIDEPKQLPPEEVNRWYEVIRGDDAARAAQRGYLLLELFRATGIDVPPGTTQLPESPPANARLVMPDAGSLQGLASAAAGHRRAETALWASVAAGDIPLNEIHPAGVAAIVRGLRQVGEDQTARLFAIEVAIAYGL